MAGSLRRGDTGGRGGEVGFVLRYLPTVHPSVVDETLLADRLHVIAGGRRASAM